MSELQDAIQDRIASFTPDLVPPFAGLQERRRQRRLIRWSASAAGVAAVAVVITLIALALPGGTKAEGPVRLGQQPATLAGQFDGYVESSQDTWPTETNGRPSGKDGAALLRGPEHCSAERTLWLLPAQEGPLTDGSPRVVGYLRDPGAQAPNFAKGEEPFVSPAVLPADARSSGLTIGFAELWISQTDRLLYAYLVNSRDHSDVERWPALAGLCA
jgi:hypothetical protein